ncbi:MAG TPA: hypothetical protein VFA26_12915, partial [Gemmataceae bacterium]|nr:hypothetical protein [Gemmataceae bacterium]
GNVGLLPVTPGADLWHDPQRSGLGRFSRRPDLAALVLVLVFGAFANAAGMVGPVVEWQDRVGYPRLATTVFYLTACVLLPALAAGGAAALGRWWGRLPGTWRETAARGSFALVPLGLAMWLAHCSFHFLTSWDGLLPAVERFLIDLGCSGIGDPQWAYSCCTPVAGWLLRLEILALDVGLLLSLYAGWRIALSQAPRRPQALQALAPWAVLMVLLFLAGVWIVMQPMQMRGTMQMAG